MAHYIDRSSHDLTALLIEIASAEVALDELGAEEGMTLTGRILSIKKRLELLLEALEAVYVRLDEMRTYDFENLDANEAEALQQWASECADLLHQRIAAARGEEAKESKR